MASPPPPVPRRPRPATFSPRFTLLICYFGLFMVFYGILFALPDLIAAARDLPPGPAELSPEERARAREIARNALRGRLPWVVAAASATLGLALWRSALPGLRRR